MARKVNPAGVYTDSQFTLVDNIIPSKKAKFRLDNLPAATTAIINFPSTLEPLMMGGYLDARSFGAKGDGVADDTAAIQTAIDYAAGIVGQATGGITVYLHAGIYDIGTLNLRQHVRLLGDGEATILRAKTNIGGPVIQAASPGDRFLWVESLRVDGNKANQFMGGGTNHGIWFNTPTNTPQEYADAYHRIINVTVINTIDDGIRLEGRGENKVIGCTIRDVNGNGIVVDAPDCDVSQTTAGRSGFSGFVISEANNRLTNCKAFYSGFASGIFGYGFWINGTHTVTLDNCEAQDNQNHGFYALNSDRVQCLGCTADSNNAGNNGDSDRNADGFHFNNSSYGRVIGASRDRGANPRPQKYALGITNGSTYLSFDLKSDGNLSGHVRNGWHIGLNGAINGYGGEQDVAYAASITLDPTKGNYIRVAPLTGNITVNAPTAANTWTGAEMTLKFIQDATGGRQITWGSGFRVSWSASTAPNFVETITLRYDSTEAEWTQVATGTRYVNAAGDIMFGSLSLHKDQAGGFSAVSIQNLNTGNNTTKRADISFFGRSQAGTVKNSGMILVEPEDADYIDSAMVLHSRNGDSITEMLRLSGDNIVSTPSGVNLRVGGLSGSGNRFIMAGPSGDLLTSGGVPGLEFITAVNPSAVSAQSINNCFTSTYKDYLVLLHLDSQSADATLRMRLRVAGSDIGFAGAYFGNLSSSYSSLALVISGATGQAEMVVAAAPGGAKSDVIGTILVKSPQEAKNTNLTFDVSYYASASISRRDFGSAIRPVSNQVDGFTIYPGSGTITGTIAVYGVVGF